MSNFMRDNGISEVNESDPWWMSRGPILHNFGLRTMPLDEREEDDDDANLNKNQATTTRAAEPATPTSTHAVPNPWVPNTSFSDLTKKRLSGVQRMEALVHDLEMRIVKSGKIRNVKDLKNDAFFNDGQSAADEKEDADDEDFIDDGLSQYSGDNNDADEDDGGKDIYDVSGFQACHPDASWPEASTKKILTWHDRVSKLFDNAENAGSSSTNNNIDGLQAFGKNPPPREAITEAFTDIFSRFPDNCDDEAQVAKMATEIREKLGESGLLRSKDGEWRWEQSPCTEDGTSGDLPMPWLDETEDVHWANFVLLCKIPLTIEVFVKAWLEAQQRSNLQGLAKWNALIVNKCDALNADNNPMVYRAFCEEDGILAPWIPILKDLKDWYYRKNRLETAFDRLPRWEFPFFISSRSRDSFMRTIRPLIRYCKWDMLSKVLDQIESAHAGQKEQAEVERLLPIQLPLRVEVPFSPDADVTVVEFRCPQSTRVRVSLQGQTTTYESLDEAIKKLWEQLASQHKNAYRLKMEWPNTETPWEREGGMTPPPNRDVPVDSSHITPAWNLCRLLGEGKTVTLATVLYVALTSSKGIFPFSNPKPDENNNHTSSPVVSRAHENVPDDVVGEDIIDGAEGKNIPDAESRDAPPATAPNLGAAATAPQIRIIDLDDTPPDSIANGERSRSCEGNSRVIDAETRDRRQSMLQKPDKGVPPSEEPVARSESVSASIELESNEDEDVSASIGSDAVSEGSEDEDEDEDAKEDASVSCDSDDSSSLVPVHVKKETKIDGVVDNDKKERTPSSSGAQRQNESSSTLSSKGQGGKESGGGESPQRSSRGKRARSEEIAAENDEPPSASPKSAAVSTPLGKKSVTRASPTKSPARKKSATRESPKKSPARTKSATRASPMKSPARQKSGSARRPSVSDAKKNPPKASSSCASSNTQKKKLMAEREKRDLLRHKSNPSKGTNNSSKSNKSSKMKNLKSPMKTTKK